MAGDRGQQGQARPRPGLVAQYAVGGRRQGQAAGQFGVLRQAVEKVQEDRVGAAVQHHHEDPTVPRLAAIG